MNFPNLLIGGPPKCGTTSVFKWLSNHPDVCPSSTKEPGFLLDNVYSFNKSCNYITHGLSAYRSLFPSYNGEKVVMEASPQYMVMKTVPFSAFYESGIIPKVLFILRKPSERLYSEYRFNAHSNKRTPIMSFSEYLKTDRGRHGKSISNYFPHIEHWTERIGAENIIIIKFEDMRADPLTAVSKISTSVGIDSGFWKDYDFQTYNRTIFVRYMWLHRQAMKLAGYFPDRFKRVVGKPLYASINQKTLPQRSDEDKKQLLILDKEFSANNQCLSDFLNVDLSDWD